MPGLYFSEGTSFESLGLDARLQRASARLGYRTPSLVQAEAIPVALSGKDVLLRASTGSGKTAAYGLALLQGILNMRVGMGVSAGASSPSALILVPTRELVDQTVTALGGLAHYCKDTLRVAGLGGAKGTYSVSAAASCDVLVGTPARIASAVDKKHVSLERASALVVDEADLCLSYGHEADVRAIVRGLPAGFQGWLVSATLSPALAELKSLVLQAPAVLTLHDGASGDGGAESSAASLVQLFFRCASADRPLVLFSLLRLKLVAGRTLIFVNSVDAAIRMKLFLGRFGIAAAALNAELPANSRAHVIDQFNKGVFDILIATDEGEDEAAAEVDAQPAAEAEEIAAAPAPASQGGSRKRPIPAAASSAELESNIEEPRSKRRVRIVEPDAHSEDEGDADAAEAPVKASKAAASETFVPARGIDFQGVSTVINYDFPLSLTSYVHRIGRTARGGAAGVALSLAPPPGVDKRSDRILHRLASPRSPLAPLAPPAPLPFLLSDVEGFRYRVSDVMRALTPAAVRAARLAELKREALASTALAAYWEDHPADIAVLSHTARADTDARMRGGRAVSQKHLKGVPSYLLSDSLRDALDAAGAGAGKSQRGKKRHGRASKAQGSAPGRDAGRRTGSDPLKTFAVNRKGK
jgi:ATP-dependent RNA helicase DDX56/DBP9